MRRKSQAARAGAALRRLCDWHEGCSCKSATCGGSITGRFHLFNMCDDQKNSNRKPSQEERSGKFLCPRCGKLEMMRHLEGHFALTDFKSLKMEPLFSLQTPGGATTLWKGARGAF